MSRKKVLLVDDVHLILELEKAFLKGLRVVRFLDVSNDL